jgi:hypothetical protein
LLLVVFRLFCRLVSAPLCRGQILAVLLNGVLQALQRRCISFLSMLLFAATSPFWRLVIALLDEVISLPCCVTVF